MATVSKWTPFGVALDITATGGTVTRTSATQFTVKINASWETYYSGAQTNYGMTASSGDGSVSLNTFGTKSSSGSGTFTGTYSISGNGSASKTITVTFRNFNNDNGNSATKTVSFAVTVPAWTSYTVKYNANGGSGAPSAQTKWKDQTLTLSSTKPTRTGYSFLGWSTSSSATSATYSAGGNYTANSTTTLYAVWKANTYTITYNANGGSGAPSAQTKTYGSTLTLSKTIPTKAGYTFKGWGTSASATTVNYAAGAQYTANSSITLYAVWDDAYFSPSITNLTVDRCDSAGTVDDNGTYALVKFNWKTCNNVTKISIDWQNTAGDITGNATVSASGLSGSVNKVVGSGKLNVESTFIVYVSVQDGSANKENITLYKTLNGVLIPIDIYKDGTAVAIGKSSEISGLFDVGIHARFLNGLTTGLRRHNDSVAGCYLTDSGVISLNGVGTYHGGRIDFMGFDVNAGLTQGGLYLDAATGDMIFQAVNGFYKFPNAHIHVTRSVYIGFNNPSISAGILSTWNDGINHNLAERYSDGLTSAFGWAGDASYSTITKIRGRTVQYQNSSGTSTLSDERLKKDFTSLDKWEAFFNAIEPCAFKMKGGNSGRYHLGFKAQQVEEALENNELTTKDFAGFIKMKHKAEKELFIDEDGNETEEITDDEKVFIEAGINEGDDEYGLIYSEFIALTVHMVQKQQAEIKDLKAEIAELKALIMSKKGE